MGLDQALRGHFLNLYHMALSDTEVDTSELEMLYRIGEEKGIGRSEIDEVVLRPDSIKFAIPKSVPDKIECLYDFARIAWSDGKIDPNEKRLMELFCKKFNFMDENIQEIIQFLLDEANKQTPKSEVLKIVNENM